MPIDARTDAETAAAVAENRLGRETSPYLLQHADNPVAWRPWGPDALAEAQALDRPILLSVGYAACHWCHVMAHESFEDPATAAVINAQFVPVKVDREERPDIDAIYQQALAMLGEHGGWPLTMFLTPTGDPFWGGTYFPREALYGRPGFTDVLDAIAKTYRDAPEKIRSNVDQLRTGFDRLNTPEAGETIPPAIAERCAEALLSHVDWQHGGIGGAPKFPQPSILAQLWGAHRRTGEAKPAEAVLLALRRMAEGGIYDHLGGGFARYATDRGWLVPHFEKMLYDNALLLPLLALAHNATGDPLFRRRAEETAHWLLSDMQTEEGGFASARDADSLPHADADHPEEGAYYVWTEPEIDRLLGPEDSALFKQVYDVTPDGNWEGTTILNRLALDRTLSDEEEGRLARARATLLAARATRPEPLKDDKVLADWNGLAIRGLVQAGQRLGRPDWIAAARRAYDFVRNEMADAARGPDRLLHAYRAGRARHMAMLDDYVMMAEAALALHETAPDRSYLEDAIRWAEAVHAHFHDGRAEQDGGGAYFHTADDAEGLVTRTKSATDASTPSGNGRAVHLFAALHLLTGDERWAARADGIVRRFAGEVARNFAALSSLIDGAMMRADGLQIVVCGPADAPATRALMEAARRAPVLDRVLVQLGPDEKLPEARPAAGKGLVERRPAAYLCRGPVCERPVTEAAALSERLAAL